MIEILKGTLTKMRVSVEVLIVCFGVFVCIAPFIR